MAAYGDGNHWTPFLQKNTGAQNPLGNYQSALAAALAAQRNAQYQGQPQTNIPQVSPLLQLAARRMGGIDLQDLYNKTIQSGSYTGDKPSVWDVLAQRNR